MLAVVPARGGSVRIPRKNIKPFFGKPIIAYSILLAKRSRLFDKVIVSTDDEEIAAVASEWGAEVPFIRPQELADDVVGATVPVTRHAIQWYADRGEEIDRACCIYATAPFLRIEYLKQGLEVLIEKDASFTFAATKFPHPIQRSFRITETGTAEMFSPEHFESRSQDLEEAYHDAGQFYWGSARAFLEEEVVFSEHSFPIIIPRYLVQDIDTPEDWIRAERIYGAAGPHPDITTTPE